jgi:hypothetical protein
VARYRGVAGIPLVRLAHVDYHGSALYQVLDCRRCDLSRHLEPPPVFGDRQLGERLPTITTVQIWSAGEAGAM